MKTNTFSYTFRYLVLICSLLTTAQAHASTKSLRDHANDIKVLISGISTTDFVGPNSSAQLIRKTALVDIMDEVHTILKWRDDQAAIDQLRLIVDVTDAVQAPASVDDWLTGNSTLIVYDEVTLLISEIMAECSSCT